MNDKNEKDLQAWDQLRSGQATEKLRELWDLSGQFGQAYEPDVAQGLERLHAKLAQEPDRTAKHLPLQPRRNWLRLAAAIVGLGLIGGWWYHTQSTPPVDWTVVATTADEQRELVLPDGSEVILNENSRLSYRNDLATAAERELQLRGEAYFKVQRAPEQPFRIRTAAAEVSVLGTAFNLRAPASGESAELAVTHGRVAFQLHTASEPLIVEKGGLVRWTPGQTAQVKAAQTTDNYRAWHSRNLQFTNTPLAEVLELLTRTYRIKFVQAKGSSAEGCLLTGHWKNLSASDAITLLSALTGLEIEAIDATTYRLQGRCAG